MRYPDSHRIHIYKDNKYTDTQMASKTISLQEETYRRLDQAKGADESFSDVIDRLLQADTNEHPLTGLVGLGDEETVARLRRRSSEFRDSVDERLGSNP